MIDGDIIIFQHPPPPAAEGSAGTEGAAAGGEKDGSFGYVPAQTAFKHFKYLVNRMDYLFVPHDCAGGASRGAEEWAKCAGTAMVKGISKFTKFSEMPGLLAKELTANAATGGATGEGKEGKEGKAGGGEDGEDGGAVGGVGGGVGSLSSLVVPEPFLHSDMGHAHH